MQPADTTVTGTVVDALTNQPIPNVSLRPSGLEAATTNAAGQFTLTRPGQTLLDIRPTDISAPQMVDRSTYITFPSQTPLRVSLIPRSFNLEAFDAMCRYENGFLRRWALVPSLVVERRRLLFTSDDDDSFRATSAVMSDQDAQSIVDDFSAALPLLSGGKFSAFANVSIETSAEGTMVSGERLNTIVVARYEGLQSPEGHLHNAWWWWNGASEVFQANILLDDELERRQGSSERRGARAHSLGHGLGWQDHAEAPSAMNWSADLGPTAFDVLATTLAFLRAPNNQTPDIDQVSSTISGVDRAQPGRGTARAKGSR